jgi:carboxyl-terminal processing protease
MKRLVHSFGILALVAFAYGAGVFTGTTNTTTQAQTSAEREVLFAPFWEAWDILHERFVNVDKLDDTALMEAALAGMVEALGEPNTDYASPTLWEQATSSMQGEFEGIGATVRKDEETGGLRIVSTIVGSPASNLLRPDDVIIRVNGEDITTLPESTIIGRVRGPAGTSVTLTILRKGDERDVVITRARIRQETVITQMYPGRIGYIKLAQFNDNAFEEFRRGLRELDANNLNGLIFDLRDDPGGGLITSVNIASQFLKDGVIVTQRGRPGTDPIEYGTTGDALAPDVPLVVLVNEGSASASELVSSALQDYGRATIIGTVTYGKGSVQQWVTLQNGGGLRVTVAYFYRPNGETVNEIGVIPDITVEWDPEARAADPKADPQLRAAIRYLQGVF